MKEKLLVLAKAAPAQSQKYEELICVAGITDKGEWRRIYPVPWDIFWETSGRKFKKKMWIEYELESDAPSDHRPESRKIKFDTIKPLREAGYKEIEELIKGKITTIEELTAKTARVQSLGIVHPLEVKDFSPVSNAKYEKLTGRRKQMDLFGKPALKLEPPKFKYQYVFKDDTEGKFHEMLCEDWEAAMLYHKCEEYRKKGKYKDEKEVHEKVKNKFLVDIFKRNHVYFIVGSHFRFPSFMIVGVLYPKKADELLES